MNTCAECRFWKRRELDDTGNGEKWTDDARDYADFSPEDQAIYDDSGYCGRAESSSGSPDDKASRAYALDGEHYSAKLVTRSDFGCVQFEATGVAPGDHDYKIVNVEDVQIAGAMWPLSMRCGSCKTMWNPQTQKHYCPGVVRDMQLGIQSSHTSITLNGEP